MRKIVLWICLLLSFTPAVYAQEATPETTPTVAPSITVDGLERTYVLHVPENAATPAPLVIALHGRFDDGAGMEEYSQFNRVADEEGFIVAYPDGINNEWNYVQGIPGYPDAQDDTAFLIALVDHLADEYALDLTRVYLAGFSNGGFMVNRIACANPSRFAGFAAVAAAGFGGMPEVCDGTITAPMIMLHGTEDDNIPWDGTPVTRGNQSVYLTYPITATFAYWAEVNHCEADADRTDIPPGGDSPGTSVRVLTLACPEGTAVVLYGILGGGHNWARPDQAEYPWSGVINRDIDTAREIWNFFAPLSREQAE